MAAGDIQAAAEALADAVAGVPGILDVKPHLDDNINPPCAHVYNRPFDPHMTLGNGTTREAHLGVRIYVNRSPSGEAFKQLRGFMDQSGSGSVLEALENSANWPTGTNYVQVIQIGEVEEFISSDAAFFGVNIDVDVVL